MASTTPLAAQSCIASSSSGAASRRLSPSTWKCRAARVRAAASEDGGASTLTDNKRKPSAGTLSGDASLGKDPSPVAVEKGKDKAMQQMPASGRFEDPRWKNGTWELSQFTKAGKTDWDAVIDAEVLRRKWLEQNPEASSNDEPVRFDTSTVPWWAWVKRFHLPEAELLNGRAAMLGFVAAYFVDALTGVGLVDQTSSFFGKLLLFITVVGVLLVRKNEDLSTLKTLVKESTFYDKQWQASWKEDESTKKSEDTT